MPNKINPGQMPRAADWNWILDQIAMLVDLCNRLEKKLAGGFRPVTIIGCPDGVPRDTDDWTGTVSDYLRVPWSGGAPEYVTKATYDSDYGNKTTAVDPTDATDARNTYYYLQISQTPGPRHDCPLR